jgi:deoxyadenosine/deoxycytidine kinase
MGKELAKVIAGIYTYSGYENGRFMTKKRKMHIALAGNIGAGKTILTRIISERLAWHAFYEKPFENPYLEKFYEDMSNKAFHVQIFFLMQRLKIQNEIKHWTGSCLQDRTVYEDGQVFVPTLYKLGYLSKKDFDTYMALYQLLQPQFHTPDLILYLNAPVEKLVENILNRDRSFERTIDRVYLQELNTAYEDWFNEERQQGKRFMILDTSKVNYEDEPEKIDTIISTINDLENQIWVEIA